MNYRFDLPESDEVIVLTDEMVEMIWLIFSCQASGPVPVDFFGGFIC